MTYNSFRDLEMEKRAETYANETIRAVHKDVLKIMHPYFGLVSSPDPIPVRDSAVIRNQGEFNIKGGPSINILCVAGVMGTHFFEEGGSVWNNWLLAKSYIVAHETAHYLDWTADPEGFERRLHLGREEDHFLREMVAEVAAQEYFSRIGNEDVFYFPMIRRAEFFDAATHFFRDNFGRIPAILEHLVTSEPDKAIRLISPYKKYTHSSAA